MSYREYRPRSELSELVACTWERHVAADADAGPARVLPDGCVDLIWHPRGLLVAGPDRRPLLSRLEPGATVVGMRLRPGVAGVVLGVPVSELRDTRVLLEEVWASGGGELGERLGGAGSPREQRELLELALLARMERLDALDELVLAASHRLGRPQVRVGSLADALGTSERQLLRRFDSAVGYGPKTLDRVLRFQRFLSHARGLAAGDDDLARVAADIGYADQAHLTRECVRLSGLTPTELVASYAEPGSPASLR
jgi:AraC-like DNA-binding protein